MINRRNLILTAGAAAGALAPLSARSLLTSPAAAAPAEPAKVPVRFCLNMSTIRGQDLSVIEQIAVAASAGYDAIEPWIGDLRSYVEQGGSVDDLRKRIADAGLTVDSAIGFAKWIVSDPQQRSEGLEEARRDMDLIASIGGSRIAAPPIGAAPDDPIELPAMADRYRTLLEVGQQVGVVPMLELWGFSPAISRLSQVAYVATGAEHLHACVLLDFYHIYKGGSDFAALEMIEASRMPVFHLNDYPADPPRETIADKHRVFPGDGVCPLPQIIARLLAHGFAGTFSLELFNPSYWQRDAREVAVEGLQKSRQVVAQAVTLQK